jgi:hypothetical protein
MYFYRLKTAIAQYLYANHHILDGGSWQTFLLMILRSSDQCDVCLLIDHHALWHQAFRVNIFMVRVAVFIVGIFCYAALTGAPGKMIPKPMNKASHPFHYAYPMLKSSATQLSRKMLL